MSAPESPTTKAVTNRPASCSNSDHGWLMCLRRAATAGCSAATQKRSVETTCFRLDLSSRYSATLIAETDPKTARN